MACSTIYTAYLFQYCQPISVPSIFGVFDRALVASTAAAAGWREKLLAQRRTAPAAPFRSATWGRSFEVRRELHTPAAHLSCFEHRTMLLYVLVCGPRGTVLPSMGLLYSNHSHSNWLVIASYLWFYLSPCVMSTSCHHCRSVYVTVAHMILWRHPSSSKPIPRSKVDPATPKFRLLGKA